MEGWGTHYFASMSPIPKRSAEEMTAHMPASAVADMMEWGPAKSPADQFHRMLSREISPSQKIALSLNTPTLRDDRPINEYFQLRSTFPWIVEAVEANGKRRGKSATVITIP